MADADTVRLAEAPPLDATSDVSLFLDFDGTLVDIAASPGAIRMAPELPGLLARLGQALGGRLAIVTGRALADLDAQLGPIRVAVAGSHGGEFRAAGSRHVEPLADPLPEAAARDIRAVALRHGGLLVETKPFGMAVHYRNRPEAGPVLLEAAEPVAAQHGLVLKHGKMVAELVMPGADKGSAVERFLQMEAFAGTKPLFVGDDVTDEDAFRSVLRFGGGGVLVGEPRQTAALWRLDDVEAVHQWLATGLAENRP